MAAPKRASKGPASRKEARILLEKLLVDDRVRDARGAELDAVVPDPLDRDPEALEQGQLGFGVTDARDPVQQDLLLGQEAGGEDRESGVLVAGDGDLARQRSAPLDDEFLHERGRVTTRRHRLSRARRQALPDKFRDPTCKVTAVTLRSSAQDERGAFQQLRKGRLAALLGVRGAATVTAATATCSQSDASADDDRARLNVNVS